MSQDDHNSMAEEVVHTALRPLNLSREQCHDACLAVLNSLAKAHIVREDWAPLTTVRGLSHLHMELPPELLPENAHVGPITLSLTLEIADGHSITVSRKNTSGKSVSTIMKSLHRMVDSVPQAMGWK